MVVRAGTRCPRLQTRSNVDSALAFIASSVNSKLAPSGSEHGSVPFPGKMPSPSVAQTPLVAPLGQRTLMSMPSKKKRHAYVCIPQ